MPEGSHPRSTDHDIVVRCVAASRFPFPDQMDWPDSYITIPNVPTARRGIQSSEGIRYPDIVVVDSATDDIVEIGEIEEEVDRRLVLKWRIYASRCKQHPLSRRRHFFVYVPEGTEVDARDLLERHDIPYGGLRTWAVSSDGRVRIVAVVTPVDPKDHR